MLWYLIYFAFIASTCASIPNASAQSDPGAESRQRVQQWFDARIDGSAKHQYMRQNCTKTAGVLPGWRGLPVERCDYSHAINNVTVSTTGYFLFPTGEMLAKWVINACQDAKQADLTA